MTKSEQLRSGDRTAVLVLGMHRSGTSASTRIVSLCGAELPANLMRAAETRADDGNRTAGFWESEILGDLHEEMLVSAGCSWDSAATIPEDWFESHEASEFSDRLDGAIDREFGGAPIFVVKDPRMCLLIPIWREVLARKRIAASAVLVVRNPLEVAASLQSRNEIATGKSMLMWLQHTVLAERETRGWGRVVISYEGLLDDWRQTVARIQSELPVVFPVRVSEMASEVEAFLDHRLRHHSARADDVLSRADISDWIRDVFSWCMETADGGTPDVAVLDRIHRELSKAETAFGPCVKALESEIRDRETHLDDLRVWFASEDGPGGKIEDADHRIAEMAGEMDAYLEEVSSRCSAIDGRLDEIRREVDRIADRDTARGEWGEANPVHRRSAMSLLPMSRLMAKMVLRGRWRESLAWWRSARAIRRSGLFDADFYLSRNPDVAATGYDPVLHYVAWGALEGRDPNPGFCTDFYIEHNPSSLGPGENPLNHYIRVGAAEGVRTSADFNPE